MGPRRRRLDRVLMELPGKTPDQQLMEALISEIHDLREDVEDIGKPRLGGNGNGSKRILDGISKVAVGVLLAAIIGTFIMLLRHEVTLGAIQQDRFLNSDWVREERLIRQDQQEEHDALEERLLRAIESSRSGG